MSIARIEDGRIRIGENGEPLDGEQVYALVEQLRDLLPEIGGMMFVIDPCGYPTPSSMSDLQHSTRVNGDAQLSNKISTFAGSLIR